MTAVDHAELKRVAEGATPGPWDIYGERIKGNRALAAAKALAQVNQTDEVSDAFWLLNAGGKCPALTGCGPTSEANAAFIAAANPAVVLALLTEMEGLKAALKKSNAGFEEYERKFYLVSDELEDLRTQAPDSWRPDREAVDAAIRGAICGYDGRIMTGDFWPGIDAITDAILALRPQTAESGK